MKTSTTHMIENKQGGAGRRAASALPLLAIALMLAGLGACETWSHSGHGEPSHPGAASAPMMHGSGVHVMAPWVRAVPPNAPATAAFMVLGNHSPDGDALIGAETDIAGKVELHRTMRKDGMMHMTPVSEIMLPAGTDHFALEPGGYHVMMMELKRFPKPGESVTLTLKFRKAEPITVTAEVREMAPAMDMPNHNPAMHHGMGGTGSKSN